MPKTRGQKVIFGLLMSFFMVLAMELYNTGLRNGGLTNAGILEALRELPLMFILCFFTSTLFGDPAAARWCAACSGCWCAPRHRRSSRRNKGRRPRALKLSAPGGVPSHPSGWLFL